MEEQTSFLTKIKQTLLQSKYEIFVDGASRGNPGKAGAGIFIKHKNKALLKKGFFLGEKTNNQAEYLALALAVFLLREKILKGHSKNVSVTITSDSELLTKQMKGLYKVKNPVLRDIKKLIETISEPMDCTFTHVLREKNKIADQLANDGIDKKSKMPTKFTSLLHEHVFN